MLQPGKLHTISRDDARVRRWAVWS